MTVLAPSAWDPSIRLEPPKAVPSVKKRQVVMCFNKVLYYATGIVLQKNRLICNKRQSYSFYFRLASASRQAPYTSSKITRSQDERRMSYDEVRRRHHTSDVEKDPINEDDESNKADDEDDEDGRHHYIVTSN